MPGNSSAAYSVTSAPGEFEVYESWRLDNVDLFLEGEVEISLPIGRKPQQRPNMRDNPEQFDENGNMKLPEDGVVTFKMNVDASGSGCDGASQCGNRHPGGDRQGDGGRLLPAAYLHYPWA